MYIIFELKKYKEGMIDSIKIDAKREQKLTCTFNNDMGLLTNFRRLKNSDFILESQMVQLNQNKQLKTTRATRIKVKSLFTFEINEQHN